PLAGAIAGPVDGAAGWARLASGDAAGCCARRAVAGGHPLELVVCPGWDLRFVGRAREPLLPRTIHTPGFGPPVVGRARSAARVPARPGCRLPFPGTDDCRRMRTVGLPAS